MCESKLSIKKIKSLNKKGNVYQNVEFKDYCTFRCGGKVSMLLEIHCLEDFLKVMFYLNELHAEYFILGGGSNVLCADNGYKGIVIKLCGDFARIEHEDDVLECGAGARLSEVYQYAKKLSLGGLECSAGIPATIGGAICMNASAYDFEMSKLVDYVIAYQDGKIQYLTNKDCGFGYRDSVFQKNNGIILRAGLILTRSNIEFIQAKYLETLQKRKSSQPLEFASAGCIFKRQEGVVVSKLLDDCGLKGLTLGGAMVSFKHANFIINKKDAMAQDIYELIRIIKKRVWDKSKIKIDTEIKFLGDFDEDTW